MSNATAPITHEPSFSDQAALLKAPADLLAEPDTPPQKCHPLSCCLGTLCCPLSFGSTLLSSFFTVKQQNEAVILRYGRYERTIKTPGLHYSNIFGRTVLPISKQMRSMDLPDERSGRRTVLDKEGNPLIVSAVVIYQFVNSYRAAIEISRPTDYLSNQGEAVLKNVIANYVYESHDDSPSLRTHCNMVSHELRERLQERATAAGILVHHFDLKEVSYAPVVAAAMLKRQQASAVIAARQAIVSGAVDIATTAVESLRERGVELESAESTRLVNNLLTVICSESDVTPTLPLS
ncbi:hypothetical protein PTSG_09066 [Salpingoeca rosetta]|uniref:Band 7 domain-containing protein n=1 Tax=Salpingoeca rosetta (strain ATCC 50818 / BSB-021) TaxID=946362 RepID=F2UM40_SALR5|nr:uncharacterized protein PTSG_09066 [Salpingoeca rosetta]EGD78189.1 hypothetical protein PTSG_09066 [Salpingoeca rosetta]|eukprot:XP_004989865.1 hypothetical protein PTSG_09066 [Salpingoeca rosetta]